MQFDKAPAFKELRALAKEDSKFSLRQVFRKDATRATDLTIRWGDFMVDFSKQRVTKVVLDTFHQLAEQLHLSKRRNKLFEGKKINSTEDRAVGHMALRSPESAVYRIGGEDVIPAVHQVRKQMEDFARRLRGGEHVGCTGKAIRHIVNIGIGGSDLGPKLVYDALRPFSSDRLDVHYVSNVDSTHLVETLRSLPYDRTLFIIASKTFTTEETMTNALSARRWFLSNGGDEVGVSRHFVAVSTNLAKTSEFGIDPANVFRFWDWVGGRYSVWSAIGLSVVLGLGYDVFERFLHGAHQADLHFSHSEDHQNIPVILAFLNIWNTSFLGYKTRAVLPYDEYLRLLPAFLQQLEMESNGKSVELEGRNIKFQTSPVVWGQPGTDSQHSFFQMIHQGTAVVPCDFIGVCKSQNPLTDHQDRLFANLVAQTEALLQGKSIAEVQQEMSAAGWAKDTIDALGPHKVFGGERPTTTILIRELSPENLGSLLAFYEHKTFVEGALWNVNSFDQWGVELGKVLAKKVYAELQADSEIGKHDSSTVNLIKAYREWNNR